MPKLVNSQTSTGVTPLHCAAVHGRLEAIILLLDQGADTTIRDNKGNLPLDYAMRSKSPMAQRVQQVLRLYQENNLSYAAQTEMS